jgi:hypothetical protein
MASYIKDKEFIFFITARLAAFLRNERELKGRSIRTVAKNLKIRRKRIRRWEAGLSSPPSYILTSIVWQYGKASYSRLMEMDLEFQFEKYARYLTASATQKVEGIKKVPAVIWAESEHFAKVA